MLGIAMEGKDSCTASSFYCRGYDLRRSSAGDSVVTARCATLQLTNGLRDRGDVRIDRIGKQADTFELSRIAQTGFSTQVNQGAIRQDPRIIVNRGRPTGDECSQAGTEDQ